MKNQGISIIEVLIAGGIMAMVLGSSVALSRAVSRNQVLTQDRTLALSLASEAVEIVRNMRDTSYIDEQALDYDNFLKTIKDYNGQLTIDCTNQNCNDLEVDWNNTTRQWILESVDQVPNLIDNNPINNNFETDKQAAGEVIAVLLKASQPGGNENYFLKTNISDNFSRRIKNRFFAGNCNTLKQDTLIYCRVLKIADTVSDEGQLPKLSIESSDGSNPIEDENKEAFQFSSHKLISEVTWFDFGKQHKVQVSDIITNWR